MRREKLSLTRPHSGGQEVAPRFPEWEIPEDGLEGCGSGHTKMVMRMGVRMIHQIALTSFRSQHLGDAG